MGWGREEVPLYPVPSHWVAVLVDFLSEVVVEKGRSWEGEELRKRELKGRGRGKGKKGVDRREEGGEEVEAPEPPRILTLPPK